MHISAIKYNFHGNMNKERNLIFVTHRKKIISSQKWNTKYFIRPK